MIPEIKWQRIPSAEFEKKLGAIEVEKQVQFIRKTISFGNFPLGMTVAYDNREYLGLLQEKFLVNDAVRAENPSLYFLKSEEALPWPNFGLVKEGTEIEQIIVFAPSFGLLKSVISGFASYCHESEGYYPVHGSAFSNNGNGVLCIGGSGAGKTTTLLTILQQLRKIGTPITVLSDDWCVVRNRHNSLTAYSFDPSISLRECNLLENDMRDCNGYESFSTELRVRKKMSFSPDMLYGKGTKVESLHIRRIFFLDPSPGPATLQQLPTEEVAEKIVEAAYHYPYVSEAQKKEHRMFWQDVQARIPTYAFHTRSMDGSWQSIDAIMEAII